MARDVALGLSTRGLGGTMERNQRGDVHGAHDASEPSREAASGEDAEPHRAGEGAEESCF